MKRFLFVSVLLIVILGVMLYFVPHTMQDDVSSFARYNPSINVYCRKTTLDYIDLGLGCQVTCSSDNLKYTLANCVDVDGVSVTFAGTVADVQTTVNRLMANKVSSQQLNGMTVACYYSPLIRERVLIDGKPVNVQIAYNNGTVTVGYPLILGGY